eukprot:TRINITY_DN34653_c0_g1_i1.p1 TRINITY_DN34653_c0_g1~~TRINITY_DN34653_c0_g1_i1.p1  ORF type:complete len:314 (+),score=45.01 TRINITY_DN34653_c0_g1_i1:66-944(+)
MSDEGSPTLGHMSDETDTDDEVEIIMETWKKVKGSGPSETKQKQISRQAAKVRFLNYHGKLSTKPYWKSRGKTTKEGLRLTYSPLIPSHGTAAKSVLNANDGLMETYYNEMLEHCDPGLCYARYLLRVHGMDELDVTRIISLKSAILILRKILNIGTHAFIIAVDDLAHIGLQGTPQSSNVINTVSVMMELQSQSPGGPLTFILSGLSKQPLRVDPLTKAVYDGLISSLRDAAEWSSCCAQLVQQSEGYDLRRLENMFCYLAGEDSRKETPATKRITKMFLPNGDLNPSAVA